MLCICSFLIYSSSSLRWPTVQFNGPTPTRTGWGGEWQQLRRGKRPVWFPKIRPGLKHYVHSLPMAHGKSSGEHRKPSLWDVPTLTSFLVKEQNSQCPCGVSLTQESMWHILPTCSHDTLCFSFYNTLHTCDYFNICLPSEDYTPQDRNPARLSTATSLVFSVGLSM